MKLVHKGSTKDVYETPESYLFHFSDRYSVFDWGEMPDHLRGKGVALAQFTKIIYQHLESKNIKTHLLGLPCGEQELTVRPYKVLRDQTPMPRTEDLFVPLEVIFRLGVATGSSLLKKDLGYRELQRFEGPMIEFTTKLERFDRPLTHPEARELAGMNEVEWARLLETTRTIARELEAFFLPHGIVLWDGKVEYALGKEKGAGREIILVDSIGPDELRLTKDSVQLSKEVIRQYYRKSPWYAHLEHAKKDFGTEFKRHITEPGPLPSDFLTSVEEMYRLLPEVIANLPGAKEKLDLLLPRLKGQP